jgi:phospholipase/carboxylesterase
MRLEPPAARVRGAFEVSFALPWRLDGAASTPEAPLVLALHGQGMLEDSFASVVRGLFDLPYHFLLPRAPWPFEVRRDSRIGASWYPYDGDAERFLDELGRTEAMLLGLLRDVESRHGLRPAQRIVLGFSQGGYVGGVVAFRNLELFGGLVVSGARVKTEVLENELRAAAGAGFRVLLVHGLRDVAVLPEAAERSRDALQAAGVAVELHSFDHGHLLGKHQVETIRSWLVANFGGAGACPAAQR